MCLYFTVLILIIGTSVSNGEVKIACENNDLQLNCDHDEVITVSGATFGRTDPLICPSDDAFFSYNNNCNAENTLEIVEEKCNGERNCSVPATTTVFGNPCEKTLKYLTVNYTCTHVSCPEHEVYSACASDCQKTCQPESERKVCSCRQGCVCKQGFIRSKADGKCIDVKNCSYDDTNGGRIMGGHDAKTGQFPYMVSLHYGPAILALIDFVCGASIINARWVLTAAHCIVDPRSKIIQWPFSSFWVRAGSKYIGSGGQFVQASRTIVHPRFQNFGNYLNDIALVQLGSYLTLNSNVKPLTLPKQDEVFNGTGTLSGWGYNNVIGIFFTTPTTLQTADVPIMTNKDCGKAIYKYSNVNITIPATEVCTGPLSGSVYICNGDSGGPLVSVQGTKVVQVGITSYYYGTCLSVGLPSGFFTRVSSYIDYINSIIG